MTIFPKSRDKWIALPLFPFKAWVVIAFPFYLLTRAFAFGQYARHGTGEFGSIVMLGYFIAVPALLFGALIQSIFCKRGQATRTVVYAFADMIVVFGFYSQ